MLQVGYTYILSLKLSSVYIEILRVAASSQISMGNIWTNPRTMATTGGSYGSSGLATTLSRRPR